ncbi:MAG: DUF58 domain-containing protein [Thermodesulfobacteriota bacterium]
MTRSWSLVTSLSLILLLAGLLLKNGVLLAVALPYLLFSLAPFWRSMEEPTLVIERSLEPQYLLGQQPCHMTLSIQNVGSDLEEVFLADVLPVGLRAEGDFTYHGMLRSGQTETFLSILRVVRGKYEFSGFRVLANDPLGMRRYEKFVPSPATLAVLPAMERLERLKISPRRTRVYTGAIRSRESGAGVEFFGTRAYVSGDPMRHLNWKAGAHWDLLITNLFEQERVADVGIILDARSVVEVRADGESLFEHSIRAAASLAEYFLREGNRVGLLIYGHMIQWTFPGYGKAQRARILAALAKAELGEHAVFKELEHLPTRLFPSESQIVLVSPILPGDVAMLRYLHALGYRVLVISPDPIAFEKRFLPQEEYTVLAERLARMQRDATLSKLRRGRVNVVEWDVAIPLHIPIKQEMVGVKRWSVG